MIKLQKEDVEIGKGNKEYKEKYINNPTFKAAKKTLKRSKKNKYVPFNPTVMR